MSSIYKTRKIDGRTRSEHRVIMEATLGRPLRPDELVHHINGDKRDNRPENLEVLSHAEHSRHHNQKHPTTRHCDVCGDEYAPDPTKRARSRTCSRECFAALASAQRSGEGNGMSKLTDSQRAEIRSWVARGDTPQRDIAAHYGVSSSTITWVKKSG